MPPNFDPLEPEILDLLRLPNEGERDDEAEEYLRQSGWNESWIGHIVTKKPVEPTREEVEANPLSRSCKLRALEKRAL